jgi:alpha-L-arabinofuranosidase
MKNIFAVILIALSIFTQRVSANGFAINGEPDSAYLFSYGTNGLRFAWSLNQQQWTSIGNGHVYIVSDYGRWGSEKKMIAPYLIQGRNREWQLVWALNDYTLQFAQASSKNLVNWSPQSYPYVSGSKNVLRPVITYNKVTDVYTIVYADAGEKYFQTTTSDFKVYTRSTEVPASNYNNGSVTISLGGVLTKGQVHRVAWPVVDALIKAYQLQQYKSRLNSETTKDDAQRFAGLIPVDATIVLQPANTKPISNLLTGIFFEDINYAADGGLYAELVQNRGFEYQLSDKAYRDKAWINTHAWTLQGDGAAFSIDSIAPVHANNMHYAVLEIKHPGAFLVNSGFDGMAVKKGEIYNFSAFIKQLKGKGVIEIRLVSDKEGVVAKAQISNNSSSWKNRKASLIAAADAANAHLELQPLYAGTVAFDMVSLFPQKTFKGRKNGLRTDLAEMIAGIHPKFVRFPGGCVAHGDGIQNIYKWKNSIGPLETRKPDRNLWGYHQSMGLGYFEYFQFCEDIGAEPLPVLAAAVPCQNSGTGGGGQQGGIPMNEMDAYIQDIIDLVEYANGDVHTTWGKKRAEAGHPQPFHLKYIGIGNEDQVTEVFRERFDMIYKALRKAHPEITIIGTVGPFYEGTDYDAGWKIANELKIPIVDEHYYQSPGWFINNQDFYDRYDRSKSKVYLGEYAASLPGGNKSYWETALAEALYLTSLERNGDIVTMASYAPLLAKEGHTQWNPDMIYFNNTEIKPTPSYYVQQLYGQHAGDHYIPALITLSNTQDNVSRRVACSVVKDSKTNDLIVKLVNLLPVAANTTIDFNGMIPDGNTASKTVLVGNPADKSVQPLTSTITVTGKTGIGLPAYSFIVIRVKSK